ncbi:ribosomal RNA small subunit methyltransferase G [Desulfomarina profundi]|uniref:Ribosomal RNA small subunit methyltransferase G n=1 Tax=Desulfomarina profundi TaxID=2772557 RepID=A0A8D5JQ14_9BACT|nr:16S rRNA (guanine(527)-N(7))-methyltransferase RsmG [Desulfomarina profundi]BCL61880.1 ribosomal RNA small subunit methyltransferase G [Desulfomarina profundi]
MMGSSFRDRLQEGLVLLDLDVDRDGCKRLELYFDELRKWSSKVNLISRTSSDEQIIENHFLDSLALLPLLESEKCRLLDVGTGAGFPGLVCKAVRPDIDLTLVEPRKKRVFFLHHIVRVLGLQSVSIFDCRIEDEQRLGENHDFTDITSRAVSDIDMFLRMVQRFSAGGAKIICMKGPRWREEVALVSGKMKKLYNLRKNVEITLPFSGAERAFLVYTTVAGSAGEKDV